jgi:hypothetical protein
MFPYFENDDCETILIEIVHKLLKFVKNKGIALFMCTQYCVIKVVYTKLYTKTTSCFYCLEDFTNLHNILTKLFSEF